jgi:hypothetical protein
LVDTFISCHLTYLHPDTPGRDYLKGGVVRRLLYLTVLSMLVVAMTASVALAQPQRAPSGADGSYNCADFDTQTQAQNYYEGQGGVSGGDPDGLDADQDGIACETLPPGAEEVTKTFELTLIGEVPEGESFGVNYAAIFPTGEDPSDIVVLCNDSALAGAQVPPCESGGVYSESVTFPEGTALSHSFFRDIQQGIEFQSGDEILHSDKVPGLTNTSRQQPISISPLPSIRLQAMTQPLCPIPADPRSAQLLPCWAASLSSPGGCFSGVV